MPHPLRATALLACLLASLSAAVAQQLYKSVGPDGRIVYSDRPPSEGRLEKTIKVVEPPSSDLAARSSSYVEQLRRLRAASSKVAAAPGGTVLYSAQWCVYCKQAKAFLASRNIAYSEIDIDTPQGLASFASVGGGKGVPVLIHGSARVQGFSQASYEAALAKAP